MEYEIAKTFVLYTEIIAITFLLFNIIFYLISEFMYKKSTINNKYKKQAKQFKFIYRVTTILSGLSVVLFFTTIVVCVLSVW